MRRRQSPHETTAYKTAQTFFCLDVDTHQPVAFTTASAARTVTQATPELLAMAQAILQPSDPRPLVLADTEHISAELFDRCDKIPLESSIRVTGTVREDKRAPGGFELSLEDLQVFHEAPGDLSKLRLSRDVLIVEAVNGG